MVNYLSLILLLACFYWLDSYLSRESSSLDILGASLIAVGSIAFLAVVASFIGAHLRTKLWHLTHSSFENLDEREQQAVHGAVSLSYSIFAVLCLSILMVTELMKDQASFRFDLPLMPMIAALIYAAHTLPSSILAWTQKEV
jgi:hypothetical protein